ncbi:phosphonate C-P lyase system protein PhnG [Ktedonosporobacter rubrisoli]|uniref:Phosphonate C-P lyase system protein PhnG n=1 Tax=Ktedonosporobacter rubrisoli TaxID=2509675 RepID=A0A4P6JMB3_KTERU|nr:phosphonate C-P lyase system protein PhnG [Ktedonosporobacter rubrisoli]QBD76379.1 phosphonate C-P lyase system protein PhnG [Ktedonosporobacter rubrisoli]
MNQYHILANCPEEQACQLATDVLQSYRTSQVKLLSGPRQGLVMLKVRETVADSQFYAGEVLVTEVKLELDGQFGFGMVIGDSPRHAMAVALVDAALRKGGLLAADLSDKLGQLRAELERSRQQLYQRVSSSKVNFELM